MWRNKCALDLFDEIDAHADLEADHAIYVLATASGNTRNFGKTKAIHDRICCAESVQRRSISDIANYADAELRKVRVYRRFGSTVAPD